MSQPAATGDALVPQPSVAALLWLEWRRFVNRVRTIARNPRRLIPWLLILIWLVPSFIGRLVFATRVSRRPTAATGFIAGLGAVAGFVPGAALVLLGLAFFRAPMRPVAAFQSPADARFVIGAGYDSRLIVAWLTLRNARLVLVTGLLYGVFLLFIYVPGLGLTATQTVAGALGLALLSACVLGSQMAAFAIRRYVGTAAVQLVGTAALVVGIASLVSAVAQMTGTDSLPRSVAGVLREVPPGAWLVDAVHGYVVADLYLALLAVALNGVGILGSGDCYPELWEVSSRVFYIRRAARKGGGAFTVWAARRELRRRERPAERESAPSSGGRFAPAGPWIVLWKEWLAMRRQAGGAVTQIVIFICSVVGGWLVGYFEARHRGAPVLTIEIPLLGLLFSALLTLRMATDLRSPLWWLSDSALLARLSAWTLARALRIALPVLVFVEVSVLVDRNRAGTVVVALLPIPLFLLAWLIQAVSLAVYSMLPARSDFRVGQMLRIFAIYGVFVSLFVGVIPGFFARSIALIIVLPSLLAVGELIGFLVFASWRIQGNGIAFAREESQ